MCKALRTAQVPQMSFRLLPSFDYMLTLLLLSAPIAEAQNKDAPLPPDLPSIASRA